MPATPETNADTASSANSDSSTVGSVSTGSSSQGSHTHRRRSRRRHTIFFDLTETSDPRFDRIIEVLLIVLLIFAPLALGAVQAWSEMIVILIAATMALVLGCKLIARLDIRFI